ncbi:MAG: alkaline phosphatase family protein [Burkholderiaceae bacterium]|nr:alkaline phosphatase family protein [Burkholderiaceae bacterium]
MIRSTPRAPTDFGAASSIVSLAATLAGRFADGGTVPALRDRAVADALDSSRSAVFVLMDGLGEAALALHAPDGALAHFRFRTLDSVFPSSTAPALSALSAAAPPATHGNPGWLMWSDAAGALVRTLPMDLRADHEAKVLAADTWHWSAWTARCAVPAFALLPVQLADSEFSRHTYAGTTIVGYRSLNEVCDRIDELFSAVDEAYVFVYLPHFDTVSHEAGCASQKAGAVVRRLDAWFAQLVERMRAREAIVLATADHGFVDIADDDQLQLEDFPSIAAYLDRPLSGEPRVPFCSVRADAQERFGETVRSALGDAFDVHRSQDLLAAGWFGAGDALVGRIGTHVLVPRRRVTLIDTLEGEKPMRFIGMHGGPSEDEMRVPLLAARRGEPLG